MLKNTIYKTIMPNNLTYAEKIIFSYRYFSLILTSIFYLIENLHSPLKNKLMIIVCLTVCSILLNNLYIINQDTKKIIRILVSIEVIGNTFILIPTGGLNSPYIWYALNTILITISFLDIYFCAINLSIYLIFSALISFLIFNNKSKYFMQLVFDNSNLILSFILVTVAAQLLLKLIKNLRNKSNDLSIANTRLSISNERIKESMINILSLYQAVHSFADQDRKDKLIAIIINYTQKITKSNFAFFCLKINEYEWYLETSKKDDNFKFILLKKIDSHWDMIKNSDKPLNFNINGTNYIEIAVKSAHREYGVLGIKFNNNHSTLFYEDNLMQLRFLSDLSSITFEKFQLEDINARLLISEEQNRIANEIHDSVSQRLFSISCCIHDLIKKKGNITEENLTSELETIKGSLKKVMEELRETIYGLSWKKGGLSRFKLEIEDYLDEVSNLNKVEISFNFIGNEELLSCDYKKTLYRIICEGTGNAIRHGKCSKIQITLDIKKDYIHLTITDNGKGFCYDKIDSRETGLGLKNIVNLVSFFNGEINVESQIEIGTVINILFNKSMYHK